MTFHGWGGMKKKGVEETKAKKCMFKTYKIENKRNHFKLEKKKAQMVTNCPMKEKQCQH